MMCKLVIIITYTLYDNIRNVKNIHEVNTAN